MGRALVLAGGGVTGIAWEVGVVAGLADAGVDVRIADLVVGTSAGAAVGAQITSGEPLDALVARQHGPSAEIPAELDLSLLATIFGPLFDESLTVVQRRAAVGASALAAETVSEQDRLAAIAARLPSFEWPERRLALTAVDATSGELVVFEAGSGVALVDAVAASCAVPGVWPPVTIGDRRYIDGGVASPFNSSLADGHEQVLVVTPMSPLLSAALDEEVSALRDQGAEVAVIRADDEALAAMGDNALDPTRRGVAVDAGFRQGRAEADALRGAWAG